MLRLQNGNFGDCKPVGSGVWELRVDWGSGYRVYYALADKRSQAKDIERALQRWDEWQTRSNR
ncbi:type II toxin-antitoxin system RelE/ParE family toxin [Serpentinimonas barnesii]|uniref:type II toxin-antitoxin system RelE/ParE family toxin n=1 Tax=Serpentinimonas barnesii TaxID=1458427 RepID=UPI003F6F2C7C